MKAIKITIIETLDEIRLEVDEKLNSRIRLARDQERTEARKEMKLAAFDLCYHYSNVAIDRLEIQWFNNF